MNSKLTVEEARRLFSYCPDTGVVTRRVTTSSRARAGTAVGSLSNGYLWVRVNGPLYPVHRLAWLLHYGEWPAGQIDHQNGVRTDNRCGNLRDVTNKENCRNSSTPSHNTSGAIGVHWYKARSIWQAGIKVNGRQIFLGYFSKRGDAIQARKEAEGRYGFHPNHGKFITNNIVER